jgi:hypothetical protein
MSAAVRDAIGLTALVLLLIGCRGDEVGPSGGIVGGACASDRDCAHRCLSDNSHYPGGMCTLSCSRDADCPSGTSCVDDAGGICAINCVSDGDCRPFGRDYRCDDKGRKGAGGEALVCRVG